MNEFLNKEFIEYRNLLQGLFHSLHGSGKPFLLYTEIEEEVEDYCNTVDTELLKETETYDLLLNTQEAALRSPWICLAVRRGKAKWEYYRINKDILDIYSITVSEYLKFKEEIINKISDESWILEIDFGPFSRDFPRMVRERNIGKGVQFLNRYLSGKMMSSKSNGANQMFEFLKVHQVQGVQLMLNNNIHNQEEMTTALKKAEKFLSKQRKEVNWSEIESKMRSMGFEPGWGEDVKTALESFNLLMDILEAPSHENFEEFLARIPMIFSIAIISPHGYFGQKDVLGLPDTGGQVVYILDQVKALEKEMIEQSKIQGLKIKPKILIVTRLIPESGKLTCNQPLEKVNGTKYAKILRIPFRNDDESIVPHWISRFKIWPYLERFSREATKEIKAELGSKPDLVIGNYSDGNLVASLISKHFKVTQCNIAHALEKSKYLFSDIYWKNHESEHHFSCQFTADLIAMNSADFIITSTYQEIAGDARNIGQYESYSQFTMPDLYRVVNGIDVFDPKFNIVSPGADEEIYFPYSDDEKRFTHLNQNIEQFIFTEDNDSCRGCFIDRDKPIIFLMSRLDKIKNISGFVEWYGRNDSIREKANVLIVAGVVNPEKSSDFEEKEQIDKMHRLIDKFELDDILRWQGKIMEKNFAGELYRHIADSRGVFVQPALFEAFGLTVIEAMISGLPTFATMFGGPSEIIIDGESGFHIDPNRGDEAADKISDFFQKCEADSSYWNRVSKAGIDRVLSNYTWRLYAKRLMTLSRIYGFWKHNTNLEREETQRYLDMFYGYLFRQRAALVPTYDNLM